MWRQTGLIVFMGLVFSATYALMSSSHVDATHGALSLIAHALVVVIGVLGASLSALVIAGGLKSAEIVLWMTLRVSRHEAPLEYWFWMSFYALCCGTMLVLVMSSMAQLASWSLRSIHDA